MSAIILNLFEDRIIVPVLWFGCFYLLFHCLLVWFRQFLDRCTSPFQRFRFRLSQIIKLLFKDILASCMGTLERVYKADQDELFLGVDEEPLLSPLPSPLPCEILAMSPKEISVFVMPTTIPIRRGRGRATIRLPHLIPSNDL